MGASILMKTGGSSSSDDCTALLSEVLEGYTAITSDSDDEVMEGTMPYRSGGTTLNCGDSYVIPEGYYDGTSKVVVSSLSSQTSATATAARILYGYTGWVNGSKITGTISSLAGGTYTPKSSSQTISCSSKYMTSNIIISGDSNLAASNIIYGKSIFGVSGTARSKGTPTSGELYFHGTWIQSGTVGSMFGLSNSSNSAVFSRTCYLGAFFPGGSTGGCVIGFDDTIDMDNYSTLHIQTFWENYSSAYSTPMYYYFYYGSSSSSNDGYKLTTVYYSEPTATEVTIDVSEITGTQYIGVRVTKSNSSNNYHGAIMIERIWLT